MINKKNIWLYKIIKKNILKYKIYKVNKQMKKHNKFIY